MGRSLAALTAPVLISGLAAPALADCAPGRVEVGGPSGLTAAFSVEIADTPAEREKGLMFRESLSDGAGMLFTYDQPRHAWYWMKNTLIPLDILFADATGRIQRIAANAIPGDETPLDGGEGVAYVLEINGGLAARLGIAKGALMRGAEMTGGGLAWPCD